MYQEAAIASTYLPVGTSFLLSCLSRGHLFRFSSGNILWSTMVPCCYFCSIALLLRLISCHLTQQSTNQASCLSCGSLQITTGPPWTEVESLNVLDFSPGSVQFSTFEVSSNKGKTSFVQSITFKHIRILSYIDAWSKVSSSTKTGNRKASFIFIFIFPHLARNMINDYYYPHLVV